MIAARREFVKGIGALLITGIYPGSINPQSLKAGLPLKSIAAKDRFLIGTQVEPAMLQVPHLADFIAANFDIVTPGNQLKWGVLCPAPSMYNFKDADGIFQFAQGNQLRVHGHNLCWNQSNPSWFNSVLRASNARTYLEAHIRTVAGRYKGQVDSWDVVNEPIRVNAKRPDGLNPGPWLDLLGPEYLDIAFHSAAAADPGALRVLNLDNTEQDWPAIEKTHSATLALVRGMLSRGVPLQAIGLESHLEPPIPVSSSARTRFIQELRGMGLEILLTEIDVNDTRVPGTLEERRRIVASYYHDYLVDVLAVAQPKRVIFWSLSDANNWYDWAAKRSNVYVRPDGELHCPGLITDDLHPTPALDAVRKAFSH